MQKIIQSFFWGIFAAALALVLEMIVRIILEILSIEKSIVFSPFEKFSLFIILFVAIEEATKFLIVSKKIEYYSFGKLTIIHSLIAGIGFSALEFFLIWQKITTTISAHLSLSIMIQITLLHITTFGIIAYYLAQKKRYTIKPLIFTITIHSLYNFLILNSEKVFPLYLFSFFAVLVLITAWNLSTIKSKLAS
ncbi:MAG: hypothetical protein M0P97_03455 [Candidatus Moranbacteria bacterium]|nr:hypothetical protein [Candidatus Moranbacteria bacterium]